MSQRPIPAHTKRLAAMVNRPGGQTEDEAVAAATANLETMRERTITELDATVLQMQQLGRALQTHPDAAAVAELYALSNSVVGIAGVFGMSGLSAVAYSLCELIDRLRTSRTWNSQAVKVHLESLPLMQGAGPGKWEEQEVQKALTRLVDRVPHSPA
jgi:chemotaxis protein histidine kinase CheA